MTNALVFRGLPSFAPFAPERLVAGLAGTAAVRRFAETGVFTSVALVGVVVELTKHARRGHRRPTA